MKVGQKLLTKIKDEKTKSCLETIIFGLQDLGIKMQGFKKTGQKVKSGKIVMYYQSCLDSKCKIHITLAIRNDGTFAGLLVNERIFLTPEEVASGVSCKSVLNDMYKYIKLLKARVYNRGRINPDKLNKIQAEKIAKGAVADLDEETQKALEELKELEKQRDELKKELERLKRELQTDEVEGKRGENCQTEEDEINLSKIFLDKMWIQKVKVKWHPPKGTFAKTTKPSKTAEIVCKGHKGDLKKAVASVNYFFNRAGICKQGHKNYDPEWCKNKEKIIEELHKICKGDTE